jgi:reverse gyrase
MNTKMKEMSIAQMIEERINTANDAIQEIITTYINLPEIQKLDYMVELIKDVDECAFEDENEALEILILMDYKTYFYAQNIVWEEETIGFED